MPKMDRLGVDAPKRVAGFSHGVASRSSAFSRVYREKEDLCDCRQLKQLQWIQEFEACGFHGGGVGDTVQY
jgi:hypothetical protein